MLKYSSANSLVEKTLKLKIGNVDVNVNEQGFLENLGDWSEAYVKKIAHIDHVDLYNDHWEIIYYFREY